MPKFGVYKDYDLRANNEIKDNIRCVVCQEKLYCRWTDQHGEGVCLTCETPYMLIQYDENKKRIEAPPAINIKEQYIPVLQEYWQKFKRPMGFGYYLGKNPSEKNLRTFAKWKGEKRENQNHQNPAQE